MRSFDVALAFSCIAIPSSLGGVSWVPLVTLFDREYQVGLRGAGYRAPRVRGAWRSRPEFHARSNP